MHHSVFDTNNICSALFTLAIKRLHSFKRQLFWFHNLNSMVPVKGIIKTNATCTFLESKIVFNASIKKIFLAQRVHVSEIERHFSQLYPFHSRSDYDPTGLIFSYFILGDAPYASCKISSLIGSVVLQKKSFECFYHIWAVRPS